MTTPPGNASNPLDPTGRPSVFLQLAWLLGVAVAYFVTARLSLRLVFTGSHASPVWPASGLAIAVLLLRGRAMWPGILLGSTLARVTIHDPFLAYSAIGVGVTLHTVLGAELLRRAGFGTALDRVRDVLLMCFYAAILSSLVSATVGMLGLCLGGTVPWTGFWKSWLTWWLGDSVGVLVVLPVICTWATRRNEKEVKRPPFELVALVVLLLGTWELIFGDWLPPDSRYPYFTFPLLIWPALRFNPRITATCVAIISGVAIWHAAHGAGPFVRPSELNQGLMFLQGFVAVLSVTSGILAAAVASSRRDEENLRLTVSALTRSNADLERFAYIASHDLQEPLRQVTSYTQLLHRRYAGKLGPDADEYIRFAVEGARRMHALINDLLAYSRVGREEREPALCDVRAALDVALANLQLSLEETGTSLTLGELPRLHAEPSQLVLLFQNLVGNAVKYRSRERPLSISIRCERREETWLFTVEDNGIGIEAKYLDYIFLIFKRLHGPGEYPGTGLGLALCKRIVEGLGGRIWAESEPGRGSRFCFTLPLHGEAPAAEPR